MAQPDYSKDALEEAIAKLRSDINDMDLAAEDMRFESGENGVTERCPQHLQEFLDAMESAKQSQAGVAIQMLKGMTDA